MATPDLSSANPWTRLQLRRSAYLPTLPEEAEIAGRYVNERSRLTEAIAPGRYLYVVDESGIFWCGPIDGIIRSENDPAIEWEIKHSSLVPTGASVRAAGYLVIDSHGRAGANAASGHYMADLPLLGEESEWWLESMQTSLAAVGLNLVEAHSGIRLIQLMPN